MEMSAATPIAAPQRHLDAPMRSLPAQKSPDLRGAVELAPAPASSRIPGVIAESASMKRVVELVLRLRSNKSPVFIRGESGVGKDVIARAIHSQSNRADQSFIAVNCAALPATLLESELFGFARGAFTGATANKEGLFARADGGTLFLDEISEMDVALQSKLLRILQDGRVRPLGSTEDFLCDVRIIAATNQNMEQAVAQGSLRRDLYYRLNVIPIELEPLRDRLEDIVPLAELLIKSCDAERKLSSAALEKLRAYDWPGNVRELANVIERSIAMSPATILEPEDIWIDSLLHAEPETAGVEHASPTYGEKDEKDEKDEITDLGIFCERAAANSFTLRNIEEAYIQWVLTRTGGNKSFAADILGLNRTTLHRRLSRMTPPTPQRRLALVK
jgi:transcriptional regulator with PAS, ATPase and Fis domain